jgi:hypothetical protein
MPQWLLLVLVDLAEVAWLVTAGVVLAILVLILN